MKKVQAKGKSILFQFFLISLLVFMVVGYSFPISASVAVTEDQNIANKFTRHTVTGITTPIPQSPDVAGFPGASYLTIGDIDSDGKKEIICTSGIGIDGDIYSPDYTIREKDGAVAIFKRNGTGLDSWTQAVINQTFAFPNETVLRDMDGDGDLDIMVMDNFILAWYLCGRGGIYWLENLNPANILQPSNWVKHTIYQEVDDGSGTKCFCATFCPTGTCLPNKCNSWVTSYHRARFVDLDGDGLEDFVTTKNHMWYWQWTNLQYTWMEWFKKETDLVTYPSGFSGPYQIGDGGGFLFEMADIDGDGNLDIVAPQFFIYAAGFVRKPAGDPDGDSLIWFKNPGKAALAANHNLAWNRHTIDNEWTSPNPIGKGMDVVVSDIDKDGQKELVVTNHMHQQYSTYSGSPLRYWPAGIYYFKIPSNPAATSQWTPLTIETGNPALDPNDHAAVLADVFGVDRDFNDYNGQGSPGMVKAQDITGDGLPDLLVPGDGKGKLYYYESNCSTSSDLQFKRASLYSDVGCMPGEAKFDDIDGDGDVDVIAAIYDTRVVKDLSLPTVSSSIFIFEKVAADNPNVVTTFTGLDNSTWEQVSTPGFGNINNMSVVAMAEFQGHLYALTRNQVQGCEVWRTNNAGGWEQVLFPGGVTNGVYGNKWLNNVWARMIVFNGKLYFGFSSGLQGGFLGSTGAEVWRYDGTTWEPIISDMRDIDENGTITGISSCAINDGSTTATITDTTQAWTANQWAGGVLQITSGAGKYRKFRIISNTANTLTIQQNESSGTYNTSGQETEFTRCDGRTYNNPFPQYSYTLGAVVVGDSYEIGMGSDESGFGDFWNKTITAMRIFNNKLYVSTGLNYEYGGQIWYTENGDDWYVTGSVINVPVPYNFNSFGNFHTGAVGAVYPGGYKPVSSSITDLIVSSVSGTPVLYAGGTGTTGSPAQGGLGGCARVARLTDNGWEMIVDINADANSTGSNENGFGSPATCSTNMYNFQAWSFADFNSKLAAGIVGDGARVVYAPNGLADIKNDGSWHYSVGQGNVDPDDPGYVDPLGTSSYPNGFDGYQYTANPLGSLYQNIAINLFPFANTLYGGMVTQYAPEFDVPPGSSLTPPDLSQLKGSQIWKTSDVATWTQVTNNGFGDKDIVNFEGFASFNNQLYVSGSKGASSTPSGLGGAKIYRQASAAECGNGCIEQGEQCESNSDCAVNQICNGCQCVEQPTLIELTSFDAQGAWRRIILSWNTASEKDSAGFNIYRSETANGEFTKINGALISAKGSVTEGASYRFVDWSVKKGKTYYYKLEDVDMSGMATLHGPASAAAKSLYMIMFKK